MRQSTLRWPAAGNPLWLRALLLAALLFGLSACGGGGGGGGGDASSAASEASSSASVAPSSASSSAVSSVLSSASSSQSSSVASSSPVSSSSISSSSALSSSSSSQLSSSAASSSSLASSSAASAITSVKIHYKRQDEIYTGWGLHLWGSAIAPGTATTWQNARPFDGVEEGWAVATVPVVNPAVAFNLITHKGDLKSPTADLSFVPNTSGAQVWVVQDNNNLFFSFQDAQIALAGIGNASSTLDLTSVAPQTNDTGLPDDWHQRANFMEIFVRSYQDSDGNGVGDFQGLISQLDYLQSLGITGLWLMPITESSDNDHGYSVIDYRKVESDYGTMADFEQLLAEAHERGIGIIIDYVINHSSSANPLFLDANSATGNDKRDWYIFQNTNPGWTSWGGNPSWHTGAIGFYYGVFTSSLPDFDLRNPEVVEYHMSNLRFWLNKGVDGFRFDATGVLFENGNGQWSDQAENHPLLADAQELVESYGNRYLICEAPDAPADYAGDNSCGNSFAFGNQWTIRDSARNRSLQSGLVNQLNSSKRAAMPFILSNHDAFAGSRPGGDLSLAENKVAAAIAILASDTPFTYYGEEIGMSNGSISGDGALRTPMSWNSNTSNAGFTTGTPYRGLSANVATRNVAAQNGVAGSLLEHYRALYQVRNQHAALAMGSLNVQSSAGNSRLVFRRTLGNEVAGVLINLSTSAQNLSVNTGVNNASFNQLLPASETTHTSNGSGSVTINVPAQSVVVIGN